MGRGGKFSPVLDGSLLLPFIYSLSARENRFCIIFLIFMTMMMMMMMMMIFLEALCGVLVNSEYLGQYGRGVSGLLSGILLHREKEIGY